MWWWPIYGLAAAVGCMAVLVLDDAGCQWREQRRGTGGTGERIAECARCACAGKQSKAKQAPATSVRLGLLGLILTMLTERRRMRLDLT